MLPRFLETAWDSDHSLGHDWLLVSQLAWDLDWVSPHAQQDKGPLLNTFCSNNSQHHLFISRGPVPFSTLTVACPAPTLV